MKERFTITDVLVLAGGLEESGGLTGESVRRTDTAAEFVLSGERKIGKIIVSGGYPLDRKSAPDISKREAPLMATRLRDVWEIEGVRVEAEPRTTLESFANTIKVGHLTPGEYAEGRRALAIVTNQLHGRRAGLIAQYALDISGGGLFRVPVDAERKPTSEVAKQERYLAKLTAIAIDLAARSHPPGSPGALDQANRELEAHTPEEWKEKVKAFDAQYGDNWQPPELPVAS
jgi:hypothetical protein